MAIAPVVQLLVVVAVCVLLRWIPIAFCFCFCDRHHTARALDEELVGSQYGLSGASQTSNSRGIFVFVFSSRARESNKAQRVYKRASDAAISTAGS
jgi:hypothetical protein